MRNFNVELKTIFGKRSGKLCFSENGEAITGFLEILHINNAINGFCKSDGSISFTGKLTSLIRDIPFNAVGTISNGEIMLTLHSVNSGFTMSGVEIPAQ